MPRGVDYLGEVHSGEVWVTAPARLHLGFLDMNGGLGRRFGSLGLTLEGLATTIRARPAAPHTGGLRTSGPSAERALKAARTLCDRFGWPACAELSVEEAIPEHVGLGSGTQMGLAVGTALSHLYGRPMPVRAVAAELERGARSGIGIGAFEAGGVILDGGRGTGEAPPPIVARLPFPDSWRVLLILHRDGQGLHGSAETQAFTALPPFPAERAGHLCRLMVMAALPALAEGDADGFGRAVGELQRAVGDHFAPVQGGRFTSPEVADALSWLEAQGIPGIGQSSWGPTGFAIVGDPARAESLLVEAERRRPGTALEFRLCRGRNDGATVDTAAARATT
ncbi:beta-ribofuranosylaminobenzene 5'-phosphate synthase family protein [Azospirillum sp.]|uniref:beta-ribofuranosylaminobenzene 5'-phosphate synthase family protein n=1 Tax=Azospirillum sp. TaxID=34012 RepID=UPI002D6E5174|nr:beta-ribofuranosylaminobenzene 5'-phosphate synthase family protein [Azospirillum sp.]HYD65594.1 beta-ribofuranosylaminobenzene 5'-phosphate synthase family protein [Azospirillum sp.]